MDEDKGEDTSKDNIPVLKVKYHAIDQAMSCASINT